jgi:phospholipase C
LFDHTSVLRFMEKRFGVAEPNISAWRRAVCGDLTSVFDFAKPDPSRPSAPLPDTAAFAARVAQSKAGTQNTVPAVQQPARQMAGQRGHRPLPYRFAVQGLTGEGGPLRLAMENTGSAGVVLTVHDALHGAEPWHFTIGAGDSHVHGDWQGAQTGGRYDLTLHGPNGFLRRFGGQTADQLDILLHERADLEAAELVFINRGKVPAVFTVTLDPAYPAKGLRTRRIAVAPGAEVRDLWRLGASDRWYDLTATLEGRPDFARRFAGKVETGAQGRTDPGIGAMRGTQL